MQEDKVYVRFHEIDATGEDLLDTLAQWHKNAFHTISEIREDPGFTNEEERSVVVNRLINQMWQIEDIIDISGY